MVRIALCDDEQKVLDEVTQYIKKYTEKKDIQGIVEVVAFDSARAFINALDEDKTFDMFILDVYIGKDLGTDLAKNIRKRGIENPIVFLTSSVEHAPMGYELGTLRYLIKPVDSKKFDEAMNAALLQVVKMRESFIKFKTENGIVNINAGLILCSEAHAHYQHITLLNGSKLRVRMTVAELYEILIKHHGFARVGSAYIVNLRNILNVSNKEVHLTNDIIIPIPRGKHTELKKAFWDFQYEGREY